MPFFDAAKQNRQDGGLRRHRRRRRRRCHGPSVTPGLALSLPRSFPHILGELMDAFADASLVFLACVRFSPHPPFLDRSTSKVGLRCDARHSM